MSVKEFKNWLENILEDVEDLEFIVSTFVNDEESTDEELVDYFIDNLIDEKIIRALLVNRSYFWDFRYIKDLNF